MQSLDQAKKLVYDKYNNNGHLKRYEHILGVVKMVNILGTYYSIDTEKLEIAAYMHDYYKYESNEELKKIIKPSDLEECEKFPVLYHSYASAEAYLKLVGNDLEIYNAIRNHVFGHPDMTRFEEILLIADYTEQTRTYESCIMCRKLLMDGKINKAIYESTRHTIEYITKKGFEPHPLQIKVLEKYKEMKED